MNASQIHLALNHVPLFFSLAGGLILLYGFIRKQDQIKSLSLYFMIIAAVFTIPVYLTGEGTEENVENLPGVSDVLIESHEEMANVGLILILIAGIVALATLLIKRTASLAKPFLMFCVVLAFASFGVMVQTAHLGGQIRHSEIRNSAVVSTGNDAVRDTGDEKDKGSEEKEGD
ncbi:MAG TPA: hypothetical protein VFO37_07600 [Chitinophagaceae bacterium]|jgi:uncharacterized membrane protein|nr:hypothetical protein [Chitinophagaceae bacterium]